MRPKSLSANHAVNHAGLADGSRHLRGYFYIAAATLCWGVAATLGRAAFTGRLLPGGESLPPIDALLISQTRTTFAFLILLPALAWRRGWSRLRIPARELGDLVLLGVIGQAATNYFYYTAIERINVATAIVVQYTAPVWVLLYMAARGLQRPTARRMAAVALAVTGSALVLNMFGGGAGQMRLDRIGLGAAILSAFTFAFSNIWGHHILQARDRWTVLLYTTLTASAFWLLVNPPWKIAALELTAPQWGFLVVFAIISVLLPVSFYYAGLQLLEPTRAIVASCLEPVFAIVIAAVALGERVQPVQLVGIVLVLAGIVVVQLPERKDREPVAAVEPVD